MLAAGTVHPGLTIPVAVAVIVFLFWFWKRLGREHVPPSRRIIRRCSVWLMIATIPILVGAMSLLDPDVDQRRWVIAWTIVTILLLLIIATAVADAINNLRIHRQERADVMTIAATDLVAAIHEAQDGRESNSRQSPPPPGDGGRTDIATTEPPREQDP